jgi:uncharacterized protein YceK
MKWMRAALLATTVAVPSIGCGTIVNLASGSPENYGGVQRDIQVAADASAKGGILSGANIGSGSSTGQPYTAGAIVAVGILALYGADLSLSFVADTLTLPLLIYLHQKHQEATDSTAAPAD